MIKVQSKGKVQQPKAKGKGKAATQASPGNAGKSQPVTVDADNGSTEDPPLRPTAPVGQEKCLRPEPKHLQPRAKAKSSPVKAPQQAPEAASSKGERLSVQGLPRCWQWYGEVDCNKVVELLSKFGDLDPSEDRQLSVAIQKDGRISVTATFLERASAIAAYRTLEGAEAWVLDELLEGSAEIHNEEVYVSAQLVPSEDREASGRKIRPLQLAAREDQHDSGSGDMANSVLPKQPSHPPPLPKKAELPQLKTLDNAWASFEKRFIPKPAESEDQAQANTSGEDEGSDAYDDHSRSQEPSMGKKGKGKGGKSKNSEGTANDTGHDDDTANWTADDGKKGGKQNSKDLKGKSGKVIGKDESGKEGQQAGHAKGKASKGENDVHQGKGQKEPCKGGKGAKSSGEFAAGKGKSQMDSAQTTDAEEYEPMNETSGKSGKTKSVKGAKAASKGAGKSWAPPTVDDESSQSQNIRILSCPGSWGSKEVKEACSQFGTVLFVLDGSPTPGQFTVSFKEPGAAESAVLGLAFRQAGSKDAPFALECELLPLENGSEDRTSVLGRSAKYVNGEIFGDFAGGGSPIVVHLDELYSLPADNVDPNARECFLRGVPVGDYSPPELIQWLEAYGKITDFRLLQDPIVAGFSGAAYVRFESHQSGKVLLQSIPGDDANTTLNAAWSLSEHMCTDGNQLRKSFCNALRRHFEDLQKTTNCQALALVGDGELEGRLRLAFWLPERSEDVLDTVHNRLVTILSSTVEQAGREDAPEEKSDEGIEEDDREGKKSPQDRKPAEQSNWNWDGSTWWEEAQQQKPDKQSNWQWGEERQKSAAQSSWNQQPDEQSNWWEEKQKPAEEGSWQWEDTQSAHSENSGVKRKREDDAAVNEEPPAENEADMPAEEDDPMRPCIFCQGFPDTWNDKSIATLFARFGVSSVRIFEDAMGKAARVELKEPARMAWAAEQLNDTTHGDDCHLQCELLGVTEKDEDRATQCKRAFFIDELPMPERPDGNPSEKDREVFLRDLPKSLVADADLQAWASEFGAVEDVHILIDEVSQRSRGKAYVRFKTHSSALDCISRHSSMELGQLSNFGAVWSESERALQRALCVYRSDVQRVFVDSVGYTFPSLVSKAKVSSLHMYAPAVNVKARPPSYVSSIAGRKRLHFCTTCSLDELEEVCSALGSVLQPFHRQASERLKKMQQKPPSKPAPTPRPSAPEPPTVAPTPDSIEEEDAVMQQEGDQWEEGDPLASFYEERGTPPKKSASQPLQEESSDVLASFYQESKQQNRTSLPQETIDALQAAFEETEGFMEEAEAFGEIGDSEQSINMYVQGVDHFLKSIKTIIDQSAQKDLLKQEVFTQLKGTKRISERLRKAGVSISSLFPPATRTTSAAVPKARLDLAARSRSRSRNKIPPKAQPVERVSYVRGVKPAQPGPPAKPQPPGRYGVIGARTGAGPSAAAATGSTSVRIQPKQTQVAPQQGQARQAVAPRQPLGPPPGLSPPVHRPLAVPKKKAVETGSRSDVIGLGRKVVPKGTASSGGVV